MATYFLGAQSGKSKESGNTWYKLVLLLPDRYGIFKSKEYFVPEKVYGIAVNKRKFSVGDPVVPDFDGSGDKPSLKRLKPDDKHEPICLVVDDDDDDDD